MSVHQLGPEENTACGPPAREPRRKGKNKTCGSALRNEHGRSFSMRRKRRKNSARDTSPPNTYYSALCASPIASLRVFLKNLVSALTVYVRRSRSSSRGEMQDPVR